MRKLFAFAVIATLALGATAFAKDKPGADWISKDNLKQQMQKEGYSAIVVGVDDGHWEGEAVKEGRIVEFHADGKTGKITKSEVKTED